MSFFDSLSIGVTDFEVMMSAAPTLVKTNPGQGGELTSNHGKSRFLTVHLS
jgi:hypothetical protein